jgi:hypothetical protein
MLIFGLVAPLWLCPGCAGTRQQNSPQPSAQAEPNASSFAAFGLTAQRPDGWQFSAPSGAQESDALVEILGPLGKDGQPQQVEIGRRPLAPEDRWATPDALLRTFVTEFAQRYESFDRLENNQETDVSGYPAVRVRMRFREEKIDGTAAERAGTVFAVVHEKQLWLIRCLAGSEAVADEACETIIRNVHLEAP